MSFEPTGAGMVVWNTSNEDIEMQYSGISFVMKAGEKRDFEINCANHIVNGFGVRGITPLRYGDEKNEAKLKADGIARNLEFKKRQVTLYNQQNENRKHMNLGFIPPTEIIKKYAAELNLKLLEPYSVRDEERAGISDAKRENESLRMELAELKEMVKQLAKSKKVEGEEPVKRPMGNPNWVKKEN